MMYAPVFTRIASVFIMVSSRRGKRVSAVIFRGSAAATPLLPGERASGFGFLQCLDGCEGLFPDGVGG